jgi:hypothetical protein
MRADLHVSSAVAFAASPHNLERDSGGEQPSATRLGTKGEPRDRSAISLKYE